MKLFILFLSPILLFAVPLSTLIENAKNAHTSLQALEQKVSALDNELAVSKNFSDPVLSLSMSDIQLDEPTNRSLEPMQFTAVNYKQKIPYFGKRDALSKQVSAKKIKLERSIDAMKVKLVKGIKITAYSIWQIEQDLKVLQEYIALTKKNIELYSAVSSSDSKSHMSIMSAEMSLSELKIKQSKLQSALEGFYKKLSYYSGMEVQSITLDMKVHKPKTLHAYKKNKTTNASYKVKEADLQIAKADVAIKQLSKYSDPVLNVGYYYRETFNDYLNVGVSFSLPLYGTQDQMTQKAQKLSLAKESEITDFNNLLDAQIAKTHAMLRSNYQVYDIIKNQSLPQIQHMFDLSSSSIKSGDELFIYISLLEKKLALDEQVIKVTAALHKNEATLQALIGEMQ